MCSVSMIMDHFRDKWQQPPYILPQPYQVWQPPITQDEIAEFRKLLERARKYDRDNGEPDCELQEKKDALKKIADAMGVDISFIDETSEALTPLAGDP